jgi:hypothetical protein
MGHTAGVSLAGRQYLALRNAHNVYYGKYMMGESLGAIGSLALVIRALSKFFIAYPTPGLKYSTDLHSRNRRQAEGRGS